jgi:hypothetical protein
MRVGLLDRVAPARCWLFALLFASCLAGCVSRPPDGFIRTTDSRDDVWEAVIPVRPDLTYDDAWTAVLRAVNHNWGLAARDQKTGYVRSQWVVTRVDSGLLFREAEYARRMSAQFSEDRRELRVRTEAQHGLRGGETDPGYDSEFSDSVYRILAARVGVQEAQEAEPMRVSTIPKTGVQDTHKAGPR